ncbi:type VII secretion-associated serine protease mycosin [Streptomyces sp. NPDC050617]|uniref:type VII secretion-associated serine protease mycosin n=1 Tax=Streptomyces sp. NPDC050617 TaxID=3154628 RepID=UPI003416DA1A
MRTANMTTPAALLATAATLTVLTATGTAAAAEPAGAPAPASRLDGSGQCTYPAKQIKGTPWSLQRVLLDQLWKDTTGKILTGKDKGKPVRVAVIDTGVDIKNPQLKEAVDAKSGADLLPKPKDKNKESPPGGATTDVVGHGTKVAGIIAARKAPGTGFVGIAPEATIIPIRQNDEKGTGNTTTMATGIEKAVAAGADVINISQDTATPLKADSALERAVEKAIAAKVVVVASAGNDGLDGKVKQTYPAAYEGVLAVGASDRNNERAAFSQSGDFVGVAAPGVEMVSTVPKGGQCVDNGTSFSAPYVAGVAALIRAKHHDWTPRQVVAQIEQTAERAVNAHDRYIGWGVVDPVRALNEDSHPIDHVTLNQGPAHNVEAPQPAALAVGETPQQREERLATYALGGTAVIVAVITGAAIITRDRKRRRGA